MARTIRTAFLLTLLLIISTNCISISPFETVSAASESLDDGSQINTDRTVAMGDTLQISGQVTVSEGITITVESGGTLELDSADMLTTGTGAVFLTWEETANLTIPNPVDAGTKVVEVEILLESFEEWGPTVGWAGESTTDMTNVSSITLSKSMSDGDDDSTIEFYGRNATGSRIVLISVSIDDVVISTDTPWNLPHNGFIPYDSQKWTLVNHGTMSMLDSSILGASISGSGVFASANSTFELSAPISLTSSASFSVSNGSFVGTNTDEYIEAENGATIQWESTTNTGSADRWVKTLDCQEIHTGLPDTYLIVTNLSYYGMSVERQGFSDSTGVFELSGMCGTGVRMVEIVDYMGEIFTENAVIEEVSFVSGWGTFAVGPIPLDHSSTVSVNVPLPSVTVISIDLSSNEGVSGKPIEVTLIVQNTGTVGASVPIGCTLSDGTDADVSPFAPVIIIQAGETGDVLLDWRHTFSGEETLTCSPMLPNSLENSTLLGGGGAISETVTWDSLLQAEDTMGSSLLIIGAMATSLIVLVIYLQRTGSRISASDQKETDEYVVDYDHESKVDPIPEDEG